MLITLIPTEENHSIELPKEFYGKEIEIEIKEKVISKPVLPEGKKFNMDNFIKHFGSIPDYPTIEELRKQTAPNRW